MVMAELGERSESTHRRPRNQKQPAEPCGEPPPWTNGQDTICEKNINGYDWTES
jgi:hypothetical protein